MNIHYRHKLFGAFGLFAFGALSASAANVTGSPCTTASLTVYMNSFGNNSTFNPTGCTQGPSNNVANFGFTYEIRSTSGGNTDSPDNITVTPNNAAATIGFGGFTQLGPNSGDLEEFIGFNIDPPPVLSGDSISLDPFTAGTATLNLYVCDGDTPYFLGDNNGTFECGSIYGFGFSGATAAINLNAPNASVSETFGDPMATFNFPPTSQVGILLELVLNSGTVGTGEGNIGNDPVGVTATPEPASVVTIGSGLAAALLLRKVLQRKTQPQ